MLTFQLKATCGSRVFKKEYKAIHYQRAFDLFVDNVDVNMPNIDSDIVVWVKRGDKSLRFDLTKNQASDRM